jgi:DNA-binding transcriptional MerR regulator
VYGIGTVARLAQVSLRTLRYYDEIGLLRPVWVDPDTGYRWYAAEQLHRLHRILALRDLGVRLSEIAALLDDGLGVGDGVRVEGDGIVTMPLPGVERVAATVIHGDPNFDEGFAALKAWAKEAAEEESGELREVYLDCDGPRDTWVVELQIGLLRR